MLGKGGGRAVVCGLTARNVAQYGSDSIGNACSDSIGNACLVPPTDLHVTIMQEA